MSEKPFSTPTGQYPEPPPPYPSANPTGGSQFGAGPAPYAPPPMSGPPPAGQAYYVPPTTAYYPPNTTTTTTTVIVAAPGFGLGPHPVNTQCNNCHAQILTETKPVAGALAWLICICCILFGFVFGCCLIPFCVEDLQDVEHRCPQCRQFLGTYRRI